MIANYHTHTFRCGHSGDYQDEEFVLRAVGSGLRVLGFSDHTPWPYPGDFRRPNVRMDITELPGYLASVRGLREKYRDRLQIYAGLECEYFPAYISWLREIRGQLDYLILGNHWGLSDEHGERYFSLATQPQEVDSYFRCTIQGMETGLFTYVAHPDHVFANYAAFDSCCVDGSYALCRRARALELPLEYNLLGHEKRASGKLSGLGFPCPAFWEIAAEVGCTAIIGCDAHHPRQLEDLRAGEEGERYLSGLGIQVLETLPGLA